MRFLIITFLIHLIFLISIFDIYFRTPIVQGITPVSNPLPGAAKRLVIFITDGLRSDSLFSSNNTPYIRKLIEEHGSWGVSHTRVPTESRPGTVAIMAGIYEDPSAVFKGWKKNPVEFDSILNQSRNTWAWGSPDIVHLFSEKHIIKRSYDADFEDFSDRESWKVDTWVFDAVQEFFKKAIKGTDTYEVLQENKIIFFLHLLGLDTAGHSIKPNAQQFQENLRVVDSGVQKTAELIEAFYNNDGQTAYIITADHGMTNWGSHGAGSSDETEVPIIVWGAGVQEPQPSSQLDPPSPKHWRLSHLRRRDVKQADIVVLLASLTGCSIPVNSVGKLPSSFLDLPIDKIAELSLYNAQQLAAQAEQKRKLVQSGTLQWLYKPYPKLSPEEEKIRVDLIMKLIRSKHYQTSIEISEELADLSIEALKYYQNYHKSLLLSSISLAFLGWIAYLVCLLRKNQSTDSSIRKTLGNRFITPIFAVVGVITVILVQVQNMPFQFNIYCLLPLILWWTVIREMSSLQSVLLLRSNNTDIYHAVGIILGVIIVTEIMVATFFQRWFLSVGMLGCCVWPTFHADKLKRLSPFLLCSWMASCIVLAVFPLLPVIGGETSLLAVTVSGFLSFALSVLAMSFSNGSKKPFTSFRLEFSQLVTIVLVILNVAWVSWSISEGRGLPFICQLFSYLVLVAFPLAPLLTERNLLKRLTSVLVSLTCPFILLTVRHENLFLLALCCHLTCWLFIEAEVESVTIEQIKQICFSSTAEWTVRNNNKLSVNDFRRATLFVFYVFLSFFGTGNIASLNSFDVSWVRCFVTIFSPFTMMTLIILKIIIPFVVVSSIFRGINTILQASTSKMFLAAMIVCDLMGLHFLHLVTNEGSWLDIGTSISHYVIVQVTVLALILLYKLASILTCGSLLPSIKSPLWKERKTVDEHQYFSAPRTGFSYSNNFVGSTSKRKIPGSVLPT